VIVEHIDQLRVLSYVDLMVCRAGATTVSEVIAAQVPTIFVPSPYVSNNHQLKNVEALLEVDAAILLEEKNFTPSSLLNNIHKVLDDENTKKLLSSNMLSLATPNAIDHMIEMIESS
jgi:UDP-N-acetylglucosamine--N-acetylmuramyl-(pentapeptide) pyrophosphoryl-undecaprenol N-acetylglucosamine transferase